MTLPPAPFSSSPDAPGRAPCLGVRRLYCPISGLFVNKEDKTFCSHLKGFICGSGFKSKDGVPQMVKAYLDKKIKVDEFITHNLTLDQVNDAIELMKRGKW